MKQLRTSLLIILSVLALAIFSILASALSGNVNFDWSFSFNNYEVVSDKSYDSDDIDKINISFSFDRVDLLRNTEDKIRVVEYMSEKPTENELAQVSADGSTFNILTGDRNSFFMNWNSKKIEIYLPKSYTSSLSVKTTSGSINSDLELNLKNAGLDSSSGSIRFNEIIADNINIQTTSGSIRGEKAAIADNTPAADGNISIESSSGSIGINNISGNAVDIETTSGSLKGDNVESSGTAEIESSSGSISYNDIIGDTINLKSTSGSIHGDTLEGKTRIFINTSSGSIRFGEVNGFQTIASTSGSINIDSASVGGNYETSSGSIRTNFYSISDNIKINATSGSVRLSLPGDAAYKLSANANSGSVNADFNRKVNWDDKFSHSVEFSVGENPQNSVDIKTSSGSIRINEN